MSRDFRFAFLLQLNRDQCEECVRALQKANLHLAQGRDKLTELLQFQEEYRQRLYQSGQHGISVEQFRDFQLFLSKIDQARQQQEQEVVRLERLAQQAHVRWQEADRKVKAFEMLEKRHRQQEQVRETRLEQKQVDDWVAGQVGRGQQNE